MSVFSVARALIKTIIEAEPLSFVESSFIEIGEDAPQSDLDKGFALKALSIPENSISAHISDSLKFELSLEVSLRCHTVDEYEDSLGDLEDLVKALSLKFKIGEVEVGDLDGDFFITQIPINTRRT